MSSLRTRAAAAGALVATILLGAPALGAQQRPAASPRDTTVATVAGARVLVDYGRPYKRGRVIFGGLVPYGQVWRTGANAATTLVTDQPVLIGGVEVPAGTYTLYTLPGQGEWQLIVNRQTGQWGTNYDQSQDLARIPMTVATRQEPVEQFTILLEPQGEHAGVLRLVWDTTEASVPISMKH